MICAYEKCKGIKEFEPKTHNQKYCSDECCKIATNIKIKEKYYYKKARSSGTEFICKSEACNQVLSRFTTDEICEPCVAKQKTKDKLEILGMLNGN